MSKIFDLVNEYLGAACAADHGACSSSCVEKAEQALKAEVQSVESVHSIPTGWAVERSDDNIIKVISPDAYCWYQMKGDPKNQSGAFMFNYFDALLKEQGN